MCRGTPTLFNTRPFLHDQKRELYNILLNMKISLPPLSQNISLTTNNLQRIMSDGDLIVDNNIELVSEGLAFISPDNELESVLATQKISSISEPEFNPLQSQDIVLQLLEKVSAANSNGSIEEIIQD